MVVTRRPSVRNKQTGGRYAFFSSSFFPFSPSLSTIAPAGTEFRFSAEGARCQRYKRLRRATHKSPPPALLNVYVRYQETVVA